MINGLRWLWHHDFNVRLAGRLQFEGDEQAVRLGFQRLLQSEGIELNSHDPMKLVLFPEMDESLDTPEVTTECWDILDVAPANLMCASSRMVVKHKGSSRPTVASCTLLPFEPEFNLGFTLAEAMTSVSLNHPHCSRFCVLGGGKCSG